MSTKILRKIFITVGVPFALAQLLVGGSSDGVLNFSKTPLAPPQPTYTTFDIPGSQNIFPNGINPAGAITGSYFDASGVSHGFLQARDGTITTFDVPGAVNGTRPVAINPAGAITGSYFDASRVSHGFVRSP
jgi:hypothetical protein